MARSRAKRRALSTHTAVRLASSSASTASSTPYPSGWTLRTATATPRVVPRARSGTASSEWIAGAAARPSGATGCRARPSTGRSPVRRLRRAPLCRPAAPARAASRAGRRPCDRGDDRLGGAGPAESCATRRMTTSASERSGGASASSTQSSRSTQAKSAKSGTSSSTSSSAVRTTSRVVPRAAAAASLSSASRRRARCCSLLSSPASAVPTSRPSASRTGHISTFQACRCRSEAAWPKLSSRSDLPRLGDLAHVPVDAAGALAASRRVQEAVPEQGLLGAAHRGAGGVVEPDEAVFGVEDGDREGRLLEGPAGQEVSVVTAGRAVITYPASVSPGPRTGQTASRSVTRLPSR